MEVLDFAEDGLYRVEYCNTVKPRRFLLLGSRKLTMGKPDGEDVPSNF